VKPDAKPEPEPELGRKEVEVQPDEEEEMSSERTTRLHVCSKLVYGVAGAAPAGGE
jgi:hypothetical protein